MSFQGLFSSKNAAERSSENNLPESKGVRCSMIESLSHGGKAQADRSHPIVWEGQRMTSVTSDETSRSRNPPFFRPFCGASNPDERVVKPTGRPGILPKRPFVDQTCLAMRKGRRIPLDKPHPFARNIRHNHNERKVEWSDVWVTLRLSIHTN